MASRGIADAAPIHGDHETLRLWLRLLGCTATIEKRLQRGLAARFSSSLTRFDILAALAPQAEGMTMGDLSSALLVSNGNITGRVRTLRRDGYVETVALASDQRVSVVSLTPAGRAHFEEMAAAHHCWVDQLLGELAPDKRGELYELLGELKASLAEAEAEAQ